MTVFGGLLLVGVLLTMGSWLLRALFGWLWRPRPWFGGWFGAPMMRGGLWRGGYGMGGRGMNMRPMSPRPGGMGRAMGGPHAGGMHRAGGPGGPRF